MLLQIDKCCLQSQAIAVNVGNNRYVHNHPFLEFLSSASVWTQVITWIGKVKSEDQMLFNPCPPVCYTEPMNITNAFLSRRRFLQGLGLGTFALMRWNMTSPEVYAAVSGGTWPAFRGEPSHSAYALGKGKLTAPKIRWSFGARDLVESSPAVADINGDGKLEVVVGSHDKNAYAVNGQTGALLWQFSTGDWVLPSPAIGDIDGDGQAEVVIASHDENVYALNGKTGQLKWTAQTLFRITSSPAIGDFDGDGQVEVVIGSDKVYMLSGKTGKVKWAYRIDFPATSSPAVADINGDGKPEIVIGALDLHLYALSGAGSLLWKFNAGGEIESSPALADLDGDGGVEVVFGAAKRGIYALNGSSGAQKWLVPLTSQASDEQRIQSSPAVADVDGDGKLEVVIGTNEKRVYGINSSGRTLWTFAARRFVESAPALVDLDGDGQIEVIVGSHDGNVYLLNARTGQQKWAFQVPLTGIVFSSPAIADLDGDGLLEAVVGTNASQLLALG